MKRFLTVTAISVVGAFVAGFLAHVLYQRWNPATAERPAYAVSYVPLARSAPKQTEIPLIEARDVEKIRALAGGQARIRGRVFRVGHSSKSNTYFLNFGPSRSSFTAVIFASAVDSFEKSQLPPKVFEGKEVELQGEIKDHPQYGLEMILEDPAQIKVLD